MNKSQILAIRACKSNIGHKETIRRLKRIYNTDRLLPKDYESTSYVCEWMLKIVQEVNPINSFEIMGLGRPETLFLSMNEEFKFWELTLLRIAAKLRDTTASSIPDYIAPAFFRNKYGWS